MVATAVIPKSDVRPAAKQFLVFPDVPELLPQSAIRLIEFRILIEFESGLIGSFRTSGRKIPDPQEFLELDFVLRHLSERLQRGSYATQVAVQHYGLNIEILDHPFQHISFWNTESYLAAALVNLVSSPGDLADQREKLIRSTQERLQMNLARFMSRLDTEIRSRLPNPTLFAPSDYNYFAAGNPILRRNRLQGERVFGLVYHGFCNRIPPTPVINALSQAIDVGSSLVSVLCQREKLSPSVARLILQCPTEVLISTWARDLRLMGRLLSLLEPAYRPKTRQHWRDLHACAKSLQLIVSMDRDTPAFNRWLNEAAQAGYALWKDDNERVLLCMITVEIAQAVAHLVAEEAGDGTTTDEVIEIVCEAVLSHLREKSLRSVLQTARAWRRAYKHEQEKMASERMAQSGIRWPAIVDTFSTLNRRAVPLATPEDIYNEGMAMRHCVASYTRMCASGDVQLWSIRNPDDERCSTLETVFCDADGKVMKVIQHHASDNGPADPESISAAEELISYLTSAYAAFSNFHAWRNSKPLVEEPLVVLLTDRISSRTVKASVPKLLSIGRNAAVLKIHQRIY